MPRLTRPVSVHRGAANFMARASKSANLVIGCKEPKQDKENMTVEPNSMAVFQGSSGFRHGVGPPLLLRWLI